MSADTGVRLRRLEWANRLLVVAVLSIAILSGINSRTAASGNDLIQAQRYELVDATGSVLAVLGTDVKGATGLFIYDPQSNGATVLYHKGSGSLIFYDTEGNVTERVPAE